jgi:type IV secretion system protein TrbE
VFLGNPSAKTGEREVYEDFGMNKMDLEYIAGAAPASDYYYTSPEGKRMINLELEPLSLAFLAKSGVSDRDTVDRLIATYGDEWVPEWLRLQNLPQWAAYLERMSPQKEVAAYA